MTNRRAAIWFAVFAVVVFASGVASGVLLDRLFVGPRPAPGIAMGGFRGGPNPARLAGQLTRELSLTSEQSARVQAIFDERRGQVRRMHRDLRAEARRRFVEEQGSLRAEIRAVLTPEQQVKFDALLEAGPERLWPGPGRFLGRPAVPPEDSPER
jgi:Spy/CpxP family protein refolding chaperone